jgi:hypothetical protein
MGAETYKSGRGQRQPVFELENLRYFAPRDWAGEGELSKWTPTVREFTAKHSANKPLDYGAVESLCKEVWRFQKVPKNPEEIARTYARRSADEIISSRQLYVLGADRDGREPKNFPSVQACLERSLAIATALRCGGLPAAFVRRGVHSTCRFQLDSGLYEVGRLPAPNSHFKLITPIYPGEGERVAALKAEGIYLEGLDPAAIGMKSLLDFWICRGPGLEKKVFEETYPELARRL